jgi:tetratricopeptide (TPR) repeat protein
MSLLLDARKKSQEALAASGGEGLSLEPLPNSARPSAAPSDEEGARSAGRNLFHAKLPHASTTRPTVNHGLLYGLGGAVALLAAGGGYVWYVTSDSNDNQPLRPISRPAPSPIVQAAPAKIVPQNTAVSQIIRNEVTPSALATATATSKARKSSAKHVTQIGQKSNAEKNNVPNIDAPNASAKAIHIQPQSTESLDPLLNRAYAAYRNGKLDEARQLYLDMLGKDGQNSDALLGLAAIAQQRVEDRIAAQYYLRVLNLDPRNAVANAGMSALSNNDNYESRLKTLLHEQDNSAALHFALGNLYAEQSRWGEAQQAYFNAYTLDTKNADLAFNLAVSLDHLGQGKLAAQHYQRALQLDQSQSANFSHAKISQRIDELLR